MAEVKPFQLAQHTRNVLYVANVAAGVFKMVEVVVLVLLVLVASETFPSAPYKVYVHRGDGTDDVHIGFFYAKWNSILFLFFSGMAHFTIAFVVRESYYAHLGQFRNPYRWLEYSVSATMMILQISVQTTGNDLMQLIGAAGCNVAMIACGYWAELTPGRDWVLPYGIGCLVGLAPWIGIFVNFGYAMSAGLDASVVAFVTGIMGSIFWWFMCFALVMPYQRGVFAWGCGGCCVWPCLRCLDDPLDKYSLQQKRYLRGELVYILLSFVAKSNLAYLTFAAPTPPQ